MHFTGAGTETVSIPVSLTTHIANTIVINGSGYTLTGSGGSGTLELNILTVQSGAWDSSGYDETHVAGTTVSGGTYTCGTGTKTFTGTFYISNGIFNGGSATLDYNNTWLQTGGTYNASTGTAYFGTTFTYQAGTFTHNNGTSVFDGGSSDLVPNSGGAGSLDFGSVTFQANTGLSKTIQSGDTVVVNGTLTLTDGNVYTGTLEAKGDITGAATLDGFTSPLTISGSNVQNITLTGAEGILNSDITVNKSGGSVQLQSALTLDAANQDLTIQEGTVDLNGKTLAVSGSTGKLIVETGGVLRLQGGETITANATYPQLDAGSVVYYDGTSGPYTLKNYSYQGLTLAGGSSTAFIPSAALVVAQNLTISSGALSLAGNDLTVTGTLFNDGSIELRGTENTTLTQDVNSGAWTYLGDGDGSVDARNIKDFGVGVDYYDLRINVFSSVKDVFSLAANIDIDGTLRVSNGVLNQTTYTVDVGAVNVDGGTLTGGSGAITLTGTAGVTISSGTLTSTSNTLTVVGPWTHTAGGTFTHNSGTVVFTGASSAVDVNSVEAFHLLNINLTDAQTLTIASGDALTANSTLSLINGAWSTGTVRAKGNIIVASTWDAGSLGPLEVQGGGVQTLDLTGAVAALDNPININKTGGSLTLASDYTLNAAGADFTLTLGSFSTGGYVLTTASGSDITVNGGSFDGNVSTMSLAGAVEVAGGIFDANTSTATYFGAVTVSGGAFTSNTSVPVFNGLFTLSSGSYQGADGGDTFAGGLTISGGTFTATSGITTVSGAFTHTAGGTFAHGDGAVAFTGNDATIDVAGTETFAALTLNKTNAQTLTIAAGDTLITTGTLTLTNGAANGNSFEAQGSVAIGAGYDGGTASLLFSGGAAQSLDLTGVESIFNGDIEIAKSAETLTLGSALTMDAAGQDLTVTSGGFSTSATNYGLTIAGNCWLNGGTTTLNSSVVSVSGTMRLNGGSVSVTGGSLNTGVLQVSSGTYAQGTQAMTVSTLTVDGGTFTGGGGSLAVGAVDLSAGTLTAPSGTMTVSGGFSHTLGSFAPNGGTVEFTGSAASVDVSTTETFATLTINKTDGQTLTVASGDTLVATGTLTLTDGAFATGGLAGQGNVVIGALWDAAGTGTLSFTGAGVQTLDLTGATAVLDNPVNVNKSGGSLTLASAYTMDAAGADFTLTLGTFSTGDFAISTSTGSDITLNGGTWNSGLSTIGLAGALNIAGGTFNATDATPTYSGTFSLSSGAYNGSANGDVFSGSLTISGGTFTASDATTTVSGNWTHTDGGVFAHNSGTVQFTGSAAVIDVATSETFSTVTVSKGNTQALTITSGDSLVVVGTLTLTNGSVGTGTLEPQGAVSVGAGFDGGSAAMKFSGGSAQTFTLTGATAKFDGDIQVAKSAGSVSLGSDLVLDAAGQDLTVTTGGFTTTGTNYALTVTGDVAVNGGSLSLNGSTVDLNGGLTVGGGTLDMGSAAITLAGTATYSSGTITVGTSAVTLDGTDQAIVGAFNFNDLTKDVVSAATLTLPAATTITVSGSLRLNGALNQLLSLRSSVASTAAVLNASTIDAVSYLDVQDSNALTQIRCLASSQGCVDSGRNTNWVFTQAGHVIDYGSGSSDSSQSVSNSIKVMAPNGGETLVGGNRTTVRWTSEGSMSLVNIVYSIDYGTTWDSIVSGVSNNGAYSWTVPLVSSNQVFLRVEGTDLISSLAFDATDAAFSIVKVSSVVDEPTVDDLDEETPIVVSADPEQVAKISQRIAQLPQEVSIHGLVKLADDGDPTTQVDAAVYYVGADGLRHPFPNEAVYFSWFCNFDEVQFITSRELASIALGTNITYRPGKRMVKFLTSPKVYAVDQYGVLRWVASEAVAQELYGDGWSLLIDDLSDALFGNYTFGGVVSSLGDFDPNEKAAEVVYPSDSMLIPGYEPMSGGQTCE